ncbi:structure-specific endonuclease subunit SLX4 isoform X2 [Microcaecilia unicolor]|uniref:Structure-specific endonuclease subunit SLX4 n=1 Tax=Microcaecilia unicolor TaxID=1415580 RepID=A0A6P7YI22_9AMPH|nr:structure-specific endonuclease subunit SLX4 isoform X2 [Microcaecilia unicolor]
MEDSDDDFTELFSNHLRRVKRSRAEGEEKEGSREVQNGKKTSAAKGRLKKTKTTVTKSKRQDGKVRKKVEQCNKFAGCSKEMLEPVLDGTTFAVERQVRSEQQTHAEDEKAKAGGNGDQNVKNPARSVFQNDDQKNQAGFQDFCPQTVSACPASEESASLPSVARSTPVLGARPQTVELILQRMQHFKRGDPERLKHEPVETTAEVRMQGCVSAVSQQHTPPAVENVALTLVLQQKLRQEGVVENTESLEVEGCFFCQICHKDLSAMNSALREQHVNRCLDETENSTSVVSSLQRSNIPECPICGKQFNTTKSRAAHLKRCAIKMQVSPQLLLQAVQRQTTSPAEGLHTGTSGQLTGSKRKGSAKEKEAAKKKKKTIKNDSEIENLLLAMVMSRSLLQQDSPQLTDIEPSIGSRLENDFPIKINQGTEKKSRKKRKEAPVPPLLIQDPVSAFQQIQQRVALLLTEDDESPNTPVLPPSRFWEEGAPDSALCQTLARSGHSKLWERSSLQENYAPESYYLDALVPPLSVWKPPEKENILLPRSSERPQTSLIQASFSLAPDFSSDVHMSSAGNGEAFREPGWGVNNSYQALSYSQKERQTLQDLTELAREGLTLTQWNPGAGQTQQIQGSGNGSEASDIIPSGFVPSPNAKKRRRMGSHCTVRALSLDTLAVDFSGMVNNPHLSDVQLQMDSGDILYAHKFVLYARCPQLFQLALSEGFLAEEDGNERMCRVLLNDVSAEAVLAFLQYLYSASTDIPSCLRFHVVALAIRFGVRELIDICENSPIDDQENEYHSEDDLFSKEKEEDNYNRADNFQELLKSVWVDEDEEALATLEVGQGEDEEQENEKVDEQELEEIYEFAATQRKVVEDEAEVEDAEGDLICETKEDQDVHQQKDDGVMLESLSTERTSEDLQENFVECVDGANWESKQESECQQVSVCKDLCSTNTNALECSKNSSKCSKGIQSNACVSNGKERFQRPSVVVNCSRLSKASWDKKERDHDMSHSQGSDGDLNDSYDRMFSQRWGEYLEPSQATYQMEDHGWAITENNCKVFKSPVVDKSGQLQKDLSLESKFFRSDNISPSISTLPAVGLTPSSPKPNRASLKMSPLMQNNLLSSPGQLKNKKACVLHFDEVFQKTNQQACTSSCRNKEVKEMHVQLVSPLKYPSMELNKQSHPQSLSSSFSDETKKPPSLVCCQKEDVIILLDSDEELESNKNINLVSSHLSRGRDTSLPLSSTLKKIVKEAQSPEPDVSSVYVDMDSNLLKIPGDMHSGNDLNLPPNGHCTSHVENSTYKLKLEQSCERDYSHEESMETSWLVPATPLISKSQHNSVHTQTTSFCLLPKVNQKVEQTIKGSSVDHSSRKHEKNVTTITKISSDDLTRTASGKHVLSNNTENKDVHAETLEMQSSVDCLSLSPVPPPLFSQCFTNVKSKHPGNPLSPNQRLSGLTQSVQNEPLDSNIFEIEDNNDDQETDPFSLSNRCQVVYEPPIPADDDCWHIDTFAPVEVSSKVFKGNDHANTNSPGSKSDRGERLTKSKELLGSTPTKSANSKTSLPLYEKNLHQANLSQDSFLNSMVWDHWDGEDNEFSKVQPLYERISSSQPAQKSKELKTPDAVCHKRNQVPKVPITPMPSYSDMDTPKLKKELDRFGVRCLPKRRMVLKLKEIFQYTHQTLSSDSEDEILSSQLHQQKVTVCANQPVPLPKNLKLGASTSISVRKHQPGVSSCSQPAPVKGNVEVTEKPPGVSHRRFKRPHKKMTRKEETQALFSASSPVKDRPFSTDCRQQPTASQESTGSSAAGSDNSFGSQSSLTNEFEMAFSASEEKDEAEEAAITPSQAAIQEKDRTEALRHYIRLNPELHRKILLYQPLELAELQAELKQNGIKISAGKLLDFLDSHCITFTTAAARKEKLQKKQSKRRRKGGKS